MVIHVGMVCTYDKQLVVTLRAHVMLALDTIS